MTYFLELPIILKITYFIIGLTICSTLHGFAYQKFLNRKLKREVNKHKEKLRGEWNTFIKELKK